MNTRPPLELATCSPAMAVEHLRVLLYGGPGVGKTYFAGTLCDVPSARPVLYLECEGGPLTIRGRTDLEMHVLKNTATIEVVRRILVAQPGRWRTVILDSLSGYYNMLMGEILKSRVGTITDDTIPQLQDYLRATLALRRHLLALVNISCHLVVTALDSTTKDELTGAVMTHPAVPGKIARELGAYFDIVGYLSVRKRGLQSGRDRVLMVQPAGLTQAKDRTGLLGDELVDPSAPRIWGKVFTQEVEDTTQHG